MERSTWVGKMNSRSRKCRGRDKDLTGRVADEGDEGGRKEGVRVFWVVLQLRSLGQAVKSRRVLRAMQISCFAWMRWKAA